LRALICGSAPLAPLTQQFFLMLGIPVLQAYGLTELPRFALSTTHDCRGARLRRPAITGIEMKLADNDEIIIRGPNIFACYWNRPEETARVMHDGWFHTGDQGEVNVRGNWRIIGRIKDLLVLNTGHKFAPEPLEDKLAQPSAQRSADCFGGNRRSYVCMLVISLKQSAERWQKLRQLVFEWFQARFVTSIQNQQIFDPSDDAPVAADIHFALIAGMKTSHRA